MDTIKVSVVIPVYNTQEYLKQCLDSVLSQTLESLEVIVVNDCTPDGSAVIIDEYAAKDKRVICVNHDVNKGLPASRNSGVLIAQGKYVIHLDSDDFWVDVGMLEILYRTAEVDGCDILRFNGSDYTNGKLTQPILKAENIVNGTFEGNEQFWEYRSVFLYFFRKCFLDEFALTFFPEISLGEDAIFLSSALSRAKKISSLPHVFYAYRVDNQSLMRKPWSVTNYIEEEKAARIVSANIQNFKAAYIKYWAFRLNHYWSTRLMHRAFRDLTPDEIRSHLNYVSEVSSEMDVKALRDSQCLNEIGHNVLIFLLEKDVSSLESYLNKLANDSNNDISANFPRRLYYAIKWRARCLPLLALKKLKFVGGRIRKKIGLRRALAGFLMEEKRFMNMENNSEYNFTLSREGKSQGVTAMLRVKNEEKNIVACLESIIEVFDEIAVIDNGSTDSTVELVVDFKNNHPLGQRVSLYSYPFSVARCGADHQATSADSLHSLAYYYNWCVSKCRYSTICKWDADMLLSSKGKNRERFKRYILGIVRSRRMFTGSFSIQTVYIDKLGDFFVSQDEINQEVRFFPNHPAIFFVKAEWWEKLQVMFPVSNRRLAAPVVYEIKDVEQDEFSHWSSDTFVGERKVREFRNYMHVKKSMHLKDAENFVRINRL